MTIDWIPNQLLNDILENINLQLNTKGNTTVEDPVKRKTTHDITLLKDEFQTIEERDEIEDSLKDTEELQTDSSEGGTASLDLDRISEDYD